jgi:coenzyme Q-binding protein COQ10
LAFDPRLLFDIVSDVRAYPSFVPLCTGANVWDVREEGQGRRAFRAALDIEYPKLLIRETFVSDVVVDAAKLTVRATSKEGPVKHIDNRWSFLPVRGGCDIDFYLDYQMSSRVLNMALGSLFDAAFRKIVAAFEERARDVAEGRVTLGVGN